MLLLLILMLLAEESSTDVAFCPPLPLFTDVVLNVV